MSALGNRAITIFASEARDPAESPFNSDLQANNNYRGVRLHLDITAEADAGTLDVKVQAYDRVSGKYFDITGAAFAQKTATGSDDLTIYPGIAVVANRSVSLPLPREWRVVATQGGTGTLTYSLGASYLK